MEHWYLDSFKIKCYCLEHVLVFCPKVLPVWRKTFAWWTIGVHTINSGEGITHDLKLSDCKMIDKAIRVLWAFKVVYVEVEKHDIHTSEEENEVVKLEVINWSIQSLSLLWILNRSKHFFFFLSQWITNPRKKFFKHWGGKKNTILIWKNFQHRLINLYTR